MAHLRMHLLENFTGFCAMAQKICAWRNLSLLKKLLNPVSCAMAQRSCAWRKMNIWKMNPELEVAPLRSCNCLFAPGRKGMRMAQNHEDDARTTQEHDDAQEDDGTLSFLVESSR
ncbi:hypothetical protein L195_g005647 [Trifolium pratense]|uniref:Uncharacterized protein n=1 Tax=Trifolium pratense TaxID=57577 RepID=A0A2K3P1D0_TRIPR|nr:hypothetical protein L195_g005647 [Trifolium pratense]